MVKDIEDLEGDAAYGRNTLPIAFGVRTAKVVTAVIFAITIFSLFIVQVAYLEDLFSVLYMNIAILLPLTVALFLFIRGNSAQAYNRVSTILKIIMILGLLYIATKNILF